MSSELLDDYEEGYHTYSITGTSGGSMTPRSGYLKLAYTKIGRKVTVQGKIETQGSHNATGMLRISLPFACANLDDISEMPSGSLFLYRTGLANIYNPSLITSSGVSNCFCYYNNISNNEVILLDGGNVDSSFECIISLTYFTTA
jgi:hypothetical protein